MAKGLLKGGEGGGRHFTIEHQLLQWMDFAGQDNSLHLQQCLQAYELFGRLYFPMYQGSTSYTCPPRSALL